MTSTQIFLTADFNLASRLEHDSALGEAFNAGVMQKHCLRLRWTDLRGEVLCAPFDAKASPTPNQGLQWQDFSIYERRGGADGGSPSNSVLCLDFAGRK